MFNTIIVPLDGSSTAEVALTYAEEMASRLGSELILLLSLLQNVFRLA